MDTKTLQTAFKQQFGQAADRAYFAPGRVNLIGEHIDYNGGHVFPAALSMGTIGLFSWRDDQLVQAYSMNFEEVGVVDIAINEPIHSGQHVGNWTQYLRGMLDILRPEGGFKRGFNVLVYGQIPNGAGLSSSASLELLLGTFLNDAYALGLSRLALSKAGQCVEVEYCGVNSGLMDQLAVAFGEVDTALFIDLKANKVEPIPAAFGDYRLLIMNTNKRRELADSKYNERRGECDLALAKLKEHYDIHELCDLKVEDLEQIEGQLGDEKLYQRVRHVVLEDARTRATCEALKTGDLNTFGQLLNASHASLRDLYDVTGRELDCLVAAAQNEAGVLGARMTGAGMGGCALALVHEDQIERVKQAVEAVYRSEIGYAPSFYVAEIGQGASRLPLETDLEGRLACQ